MNESKRWNSINNNPPAPGRYHLVAFLDRLEPQYRFTGLARWTGGGWIEPIFDLDLEKNLFCEVTHWVENNVGALDA
jgi:hypothetical protein